jgi:hypothetical protein
LFWNQFFWLTRNDSIEKSTECRRVPGLKYLADGTRAAINSCYG